MALNFTEAQLRELTGKLLNAPNDLKNIEGKKNAAAQIQQDYKDLDDSEIVYFDNWMNIIKNFHDELKYISSEQRSVYPTSLVDPSARLSPNNYHFPETWQPFKPLIHPSNNGNPLSTYTGDYEEDKLGDFIEWADIIKNGIQGPNDDGTGTNFNYSTGTFTLTGSTGSQSLPVGNKILLSDSNAVVYGEILSSNSDVDNNGPNPVYTNTVTINIEEFRNVLPSTFSYDLNVSGFTDAQRTNEIYNNSFLELIKEVLLDIADKIKTVINQEIASIDANDSKLGRSELDQAKIEGQELISQLQDWIDLPDNLIDSSEIRFGDVYLDQIVSLVQQRKNVFVPRRVGEIKANLGSVNQNSSDGTYTGDGIYLKLFDSLTLRLHKLTGNLRNYYHRGLAIAAAEEQAESKILESGRDSDFAIVKAFATEPDNTQKIELESISKLSVGDSVKVMDNKVTGVLDFTIEEIIEPRTIVLSDTVPVSYTIDQQARLVKLL